jgi:hypothetical protein
MKWKLPNLPLWFWVAMAALIGIASIGAEFAMPRQAVGPPLEELTGFYAGAGFGAALLVLACAWLARFLRDGAPNKS